MIFYSAKDLLEAPASQWVDAEVGQLRITLPLSAFAVCNECRWPDGAQRLTSEFRSSSPINWDSHPPSVWKTSSVAESTRSELPRPRGQFDWAPVLNMTFALAT
jgi:hypothetical protein